MIQKRTPLEQLADRLINQRERQKVNSAWALAAFAVLIGTFWGASLLPHSDNCATYKQMVIKNERQLQR